MKHFFTTTKVTGILGTIFIVFVFLYVSHLAHTYESSITLFVQHDSPFGMLMYVLVTALAIVVAPISSVPLIPLASMLWGWNTTALLSIIGWTFGSQVAFLLARTYGKPLVKNIISLEKVESLEKKLSHNNLFWVIVLLRMTVPVDVLSYALGIGSTIQSLPYFFATLIGVAPGAYLFAYTGTLPLVYQLITLGLVGIFLGTIYLAKRR